jgi:hypothetical protein
VLPHAKPVLNWMVVDGAQPQGVGAICGSGLALREYFMQIGPQSSMDFITLIFDGSTKPLKAKLF